MGRFLEILNTNRVERMSVKIERVLRKHDYPTDKQKKATDTVLEQAHLICKDWAEAA